MDLLFINISYKLLFITNQRYKIGQGNTYQNFPRKFTTVCETNILISLNILFYYYFYKNYLFMYFTILNSVVQLVITIKLYCIQRTTKGKTELGERKVKKIKLNKSKLSITSNT